MGVPSLNDLAVDGTLNTTDQPTTDSPTYNTSTIAGDYNRLNINYRLH